MSTLTALSIFQSSSQLMSRLDTHLEEHGCPAASNWSGYRQHAQHPRHVWSLVCRTNFDAPLWQKLQVHTVESGFLSEECAT